MSHYLAVDTGGTFTDLAVFDTKRRAVQYTKSLTTYPNPIEGISDCLEKVGTDLADVALFKHGTTLVINTLIERRGARVALVTTKGLRDSLELGRGNRTETYNLFFRRNPPLVPRNLRFELEERIDGQGNVLTPPSREETRTLADRIAAQDVDAVAICFLNSYREPAHELQVQGWLREFLPRHFITASAELSREWYEHERASTVAANAYVGPRIGGYVAALREGMQKRGFGGNVWLMGSNGGVLSTGFAASAPVTLVESGPVGGCIGAAKYGEALGLNNLIAFDMGGTTAKCALVRNGRFNLTSTYYVGDRGKGLPIRTPVIDIVEVGTGGGSIAHRGPQSMLKVGPRSAGAAPGPVCYAKGGHEPTVTDANLVMGRLAPDAFQGGEMSLDVEAAVSAFQSKLGDQLGYSGPEGVSRLAAGVLRIATLQMSEAIKRVSVECGQDARDYVLFAFGGGGPLHSVDLARELSIPLVVIPPEAGNFSAIGMLLADVKRDDSRIFTRRLNDTDEGEIEAVFGEIEAGLAQTVRQDFGTVDIRFERYAELRFEGQFHTVRVPVDGADIAQMKRRFLDIYKETYGHVIEQVEPETVSLHSVASTSTPKPDIRDLFVLDRPEGEVKQRRREVYFSSVGGKVEASVFTRSHLPPGFAADGPAIIEEYGSTTVLAPEDSFEIGELGEIRIRVSQQREGAET